MLVEKEREFLCVERPVTSGSPCVRSIDSEADRGRKEGKKKERRREWRWD